jgi:hypothetical protein
MTIKASIARIALWRLRHNTARSDVLTADEPQPVEPLLVRQADGLRPLAHLAPNATMFARSPNLPPMFSGGEYHAIGCELAAEAAESGREPPPSCQRFRLRGLFWPSARFASS